jgi:hypothetical protein
MNRDRAHTHPCQHCKTPVECHGDQEQNHDGWPAVRCLDYHLEGGTVARLLCEDCEKRA